MSPITKPRRPTKITKSFSMDDKTCDIILGRAMRDFYGNESEAIRAIAREWQEYIDQANNHQPAQ